MSYMQAMTTHFFDVVTQAWTHVTLRFSDIIPEAFLAISILFVGLLVASITQLLSLRILRFFAIDKLAGKTPLERLLKDIGVRRGLVDIIGSLIFWLAILFTLTVASDMLHLSHVSVALAMVTGYIPQTIAALLIIVFGMLLARFLQVCTVQALKRAQVVGERVVGRLVYIVVIVFVAFAAVDQLGIGLDFVTTNAIIVIASTVILLGIAFIVGSRTLIEGWMAMQYLLHELHVGDTVEIDGRKGVIHRMSHVSVILRIDTMDVAIPSQYFLEKGYTRFSHHE